MPEPISFQRSSYASNALLAWDTILQHDVRGIPSWMIHPMEHSIIERLAGLPAGSYVRDPEAVYLKMQLAVGTCMLDQWIPRNPLEMGVYGYEGRELGATTGADTVTLDGMVIDSADAVVEHMERFYLPDLQRRIDRFDENKRVAEILGEEADLQQVLGPEILKTGYAFVSFPVVDYYRYGYTHYFSAYALYPEIMERFFSLQADVAVLNNRAAARAYREGGLPPIYRLDHDLADSRGTLPSIASLDKLWFPHFARSIAPLVEAGIRLIWHCDGNLMAMVPRLIEAGVSGFQGFQYEDGMDYAKICALHDRNGGELLIVAGVSVTRTLPFGSPQDVKREIDFLVANGPKHGLFLAGSSTIAPGVSWENVSTLVE
ncbi:MAG: uroporphyrinogen decarboxylase/cobalamine-independent methonine synthase family protein, partial [Anaerolineae bacterium]